MIYCLLLLDYGPKLNWYVLNKKLKVNWKFQFYKNLTLKNSDVCNTKLYKYLYTYNFFKSFATCNAMHYGLFCLFLFPTFFLRKYDQ